MKEQERGTAKEQKQINPVTDWIIRLLKGALVGIGFILRLIGRSIGCYLRHL
jgi:putative membrane protein